MALDAGSAISSLTQSADEWFRTAPYQSAFCVTALKATAADVLTQTREIATAQQERERLPSVAVESCDELNVCEEVDAARESIVWPRALAFLLYGGLYQGCAQYFFFNVCFPLWFGTGSDLRTIATEVLFDQFVLTPFLCLPVCYLVKALIFGAPLSEGLRRYISDARRDLLLKYWVLWGPVQCITFGVLEPQWRVPFVALVSFFWLLVLSSISSRDDDAQQAALE